MAEIAHGKDLVGIEQYHGSINADKFLSFLRQNFSSMFKKFANPRRKLFCRMVTHHKIVSNLELLGKRLGHKSLPYQYVVEISP